MHRILAQLKYEAQPIRATDLARVSVDPERNRWDHPYLLPLAEAANPGEDGPKTQEAIDRSYAAYQSPDLEWHSMRRHTKVQRDLCPPINPSANTPCWLPISNLQKRHQKLWQLRLCQGIWTTASHWCSLGPMASKKACHPFKRPWNVLKTIILMRGRRVLPCGSPSSAPYETWLRRNPLKPHHSLLGEAEAAYRSTLLGMELCATQSMDLIISRLVQAAMLQVTLEGIHAAQQQHLWDANAWEAIDDKLESFDFLSHAAACIRTSAPLGRHPSSRS